MENSYFLTQHQEQIKNNVIKFKNKYTSIIGSAGTGKTLLTYDIVKHCRDNGKKVLIIHCGILNSGHYKLRDNYNWDIIAIKSYLSLLSGDYDIVVIDEAQRIKQSQLRLITEFVNNNNIICLFAYDPSQCLHTAEISANIPYFIEQLSSHNKFVLTDKIRTNKEIASFIRNLFDINDIGFNQSYPNINVHYFSSMEVAKTFIHSLRHQGWKTINYSFSLHNITAINNLELHANDSAHSVIGQEFDDIIAVLDNSFYYNSDGKLMGDSFSYYHPSKMLLQILTRARKRLSIIIVNNEDLLLACMKILKS